MATTDPPLAQSFVSTREELHRIAAHVLGRRRFDVAGRFGLRAAPGGIATPSFGDEPETVRISGVSLIREVGGTCAVSSLAGSTLRGLAAFVDADLDSSYSCGGDCPAPGRPDEPIEIDARVVDVMADWFALAWLVLDSVVASLPAAARPATIQLWPEHFDAATTVTASSGESANLGFSPGDGFEPEPYVYVGPTGPRRPGDAEYWNAPFGAVMRRSDVATAPDAHGACRRFLLLGLSHLESSKGE